MEIGQAKIRQSVQVFAKFSNFIFQIFMDFPKGHPEKASEEPTSFLEGKERKEKEKQDRRKSGKGKKEGRKCHVSPKGANEVKVHFNDRSRRYISAL